MKERIEAIIKHERLTPSLFADAIGVQRSGISHILSGRNKPSLDFLNKLLGRFPHISGDWLITGQGTMLKNAVSLPKEEAQLQMPMTGEQVKESPKKSFKLPKKEVKEEEVPAYKPLEKPQTAQNLAQTVAAVDGKSIERIIVFYADKSFVEYRPE
ncbi:helix-turn-helix transcriptional regulator [Carboxylicivirga sediminis]|uniref:Helix-turn-helix transcriptional regulator n=1 Tax=Carboxylicivirga sediminis TaxID=2006564 RepID=A0A941IX73_9BACT|nr:helix-turn-helix transcriptional regulator [Carboxylicivirga sediminis]MBR8535770.1 helix-turn-helix transcriptional regulator [Carboxylicivirga sediminis]